MEVFRVAQRHRLDTTINVYLALRNAVKVVGKADQQEFWNRQANRHKP